MHRTYFALTFALLVTPAFAQDSDPDFPGMDLKPQSTRQVLDEDYMNNRKEIPAGFMGYIIRRPSAFSFGMDPGNKTGYWSVRRGPYRFGATWHPLTVIPIDAKVATYSEPFILSTRDNQKVAFRVHAQLQILDESESTIRSIVENYGGQTWYESVVQETFREIVRLTLLGYNFFDLNPALAQALKGQVTTTDPQALAEQNDNDARAVSIAIRDRITKELKAFLADKPFKLVNLALGRLSFPKSVMDDIAKRIATQQEIARKQQEEALAQQEQRVARIRAETQRITQEEVGRSLTPLVVQHEYNQALMRLAESDNAKVIIIPSGSTVTPTLDVDQNRQP